jgi:Peptidase family M1 domain
MKYFLSIFFLLSTLTAQENYFQQYVNYVIDARLDINENQIEANQQLLYVNYSPDTLKSVYFHLYFNRYKEGAYLEDGNLLKRTTAYIEIKSISENGKENTEFEIDHTLMRLDLDKPIMPKDSVMFKFDFVAKLPPASGRYGYQGLHYDVGNWFPTPVVYDKEGWHLHQHISNEFYQEWGDFKVGITVPKGFVLGATGKLINAKEAMQDTTKEVREWFDENPDDTTTTTTWKYEAHNVHDFAWSADPDYRYITKSWDGIDVHYLVMDQNYEAWQKELLPGFGSIRFLSERFGHYPYDQITVADTYIHAGGMEYPGIVFINTYIHPSYRLNFFRAVIVHEIAHNWFYGLLGSNQTEFEWMDEGFTQFAEIVAMENLYGLKENYNSDRHNLITKYFGVPRDERLWAHLTSLRLIKSGLEQDPVNTMPDKFRFGVGAAQYDKAGTILLMLENVMGKKLFWQGMKNYFDKWHYKHPQPEDFKHIMENLYGADLDWFFTDWYNSVRKLDYKLSSLQNEKTEQGFVAKIKIENMESIHIPVDLLLVLDNGDSVNYRIPIAAFTPAVEGRKYLSPWNFSQKEYETKVPVNSKVVEAVIDPKNTLLDINKLNNSSRAIPKIDFVFMKRQSFTPPLDKYLWEAWPSIFYNDVDNFKLGFANYGGYLNRDHLIDLKSWYKVNTGNVDFSLKYEHRLRAFKRTTLIGQAYILDGRQGADLNFQFTPDGKSFHTLSLVHYSLFDSRYLNAPWQRGHFSSIALNMNYYLKNRRSANNTFIGISLKNSLAGSTRDFGIARVDIRQTLSDRYSDYKLTINLKGGVAAKNTPVQELFNLSGASAVKEFDADYYRAKGSLPVSWRRNGHLYLDDFAKVRGASLFSENYQLYGQNVLAASLDFSFPNIFTYLSLYNLDVFDNALFADVGTVWDGKTPSFDKFIKSAGVSIAYNNFNKIRQIFGLQEIKMDFPIWVGQSGKINQGSAFRWLISFDFQLDQIPIF